jgi:uncharacterized delta-60 repeat protein
MKRFSAFAVLLLPALLQTPAVHAQPGLRLDPGFLPTNVYRPATAAAALQLSDGSRIVTGNFSRAEGQATGLGGMVRYLPSGRPDVVFNAALAADTIPVMSMAESASGKLLLGLYGGGTASGQPVANLLQLNADGTPDPAFRVPSRGATGFVNVLLMQADGKLVIAGNLSFLNLASNIGLARLNADGTLDSSFQPQLSSGILNGARNIVQQSDGKLVLAAYVIPAAGLNGNYQLIRLQANGTQDMTFLPTLAAGAAPVAVAVQPDGQVLVAGSGSGPVLAGGSTAIARVSTTGIADATFAPSYGLTASVLVVQSDGHILLTPSGLLPPAGQLPVTRLLPSGAFDPAWSVPTVPGDAFPYSSTIQYLPGGQVLTAGGLLRLGVASGLARGAALLNANGQPDTSFSPLLQQAGTVRDEVQQPDGRLVAVGDFTEVNGVDVRNGVRFQADGQIDTAFCRQARFTGGLPTRVLAQPDGTLLVGGAFSAVGSMARAGVARLLASGQLDAAFVPPFIGPVGNAGGTTVSELARQPDGRLLVAGTLRRPAVANAAFLRLQTTGLLDNSFQPGTVQPSVLLVQPDGNIVAGVSSTTQPLVRLLPSGSADPGFTPPTLALTGTVNPLRVASLARYADGRLLVGGRFTQTGGIATTNVARLLPDGTPDATFSTQLLGAGGVVNSLAIQPNGRILLAGVSQRIPLPTEATLYRLLPNGSPDTAFDGTQGPSVGSSLAGASRVLVQADGAIVAAGGFERVGGLPIGGLTRLLDDQVLSIHAEQSNSQVMAWPVPAHESLHLAWTSGRRAHRVQLLDPLGREVRSLPDQASGLTIPTVDLVPGMYLLRVEYVTGAPAVRRIVIQ